MYALSPSVEKKVCEPIDDLIINNDLEEISVHSTDFDFVDDILGESDSICDVCDQRSVITEDAEEVKDTRKVIYLILCTDSNSYDECSEVKGNETDEKTIEQL